ncbi:MAG: hypothetical protein HOL70_06235, partial [Candidatus Marinimicrobia bacterium]|nr:hypothetical protein [Candidatus Neomarinimicrobiota bacterium]
LYQVDREFNVSSITSDMFPEDAYGAKIAIATDGTRYYVLSYIAVSGSESDLNDSIGISQDAYYKDCQGDGRNLDKCNYISVYDDDLSLIHRTYVFPGTEKISSASAVGSGILYSDGYIYISHYLKSVAYYRKYKFESGVIVQYGNDVLSQYEYDFPIGYKTNIHHAESLYNGKSMYAGISRYGVADNYIQNNIENSYEPFFSVVDNVKQSSIFSTYMGGQGNDVIRSIDDYFGNILTVGVTTSNDFPLEGSFSQNIDGGLQDNQYYRGDIFVGEFESVTDSVNIKSASILIKDVSDNFIDNDVINVGFSIESDSSSHVKIAFEIHHSEGGMFEFDANELISDVSGDCSSRDVFNQVLCGFDIVPGVNNFQNIFKVSTHENGRYYIKSDFNYSSISVGDLSYIEDHFYDVDYSQQPPITSDVEIKTNEDTLVLGEYSATDINGDALSYRAVTKPLFGIVEIVESNSFQYAPEKNFVGLDSFSYVAFDDTSDSNQSVVKISVLPINDHPTIGAVLGQSTSEDVAINSIPFTVEDIDNNTSDLTMSGTSLNTSLVPHGNIVFDGSGLDRTVTVTPAANQHGTANITLTVSDGHLDASTTFTLTVAPQSDLPTISGSAASSQVGVGSTYTFTPTANDVDGDQISFGINKIPSWADFNITSGTLSGIPDDDDYGSYDDIVISVNSGNDVAYLPPFSLTVTDQKTPIVSNSLQSGVYNSSQSISLSCSDSGSGCDAIYYTFDASDPNPQWNTYSLEILLAAETGTRRLSYYAVDHAENSSSISTAMYEVDVDAPEVSFSNITDGKTFNADKDWNNVIGTAVDVGSGLKAVEVMVTDGESYLTIYDGFDPFFTATTTEIWNTVKFLGDSYPIANTWAIGVDDVTRNTLYTVSVRVTDNAGNVSILTYYVFLQTALGDQFQLETSISQSLSSQAIRQNETLRVNGQISMLGKADISLKGKEVILTVTPPAGADSIDPVTTTTTDDLGHFSFSNLNFFNHKGSYTLSTSFAPPTSSSILIGSSASNSVLVGASAGYAIVVHGKFQPNRGQPEGLASHKKSTDRVYQKLIDRGFDTENINYLNFDGISNSYTKADVQDAIEDWALAKISAVPAPLYIVMVDHGEPNAFYIGQKNATSNNETLTPNNLNNWLSNLEASLGAVALDEDRVVVVGACYSGSFVDELSKPGRTIVTSAANNERSYKGGKEPNGVRDGEFFI